MDVARHSLSKLVLLNVIAEVGGLARPRSVRETIEANREELLCYGTLPLVTATLQTGNGALKEVQEYWLNEEQALVTDNMAHSHIKFLASRGRGRRVGQDGQCFGSAQF